MRDNRVIIASSAGFLADMLRGVLRDLEAGPVVAVCNERELLGRIKNSIPRLVLLEHCFRGQGTEELIPRIARGGRGLRVAVWSAQVVKPVIAARFILAGAESYFSLRGTGEDVAGALGLIAAGKRYCPAEVQAIAESGTYFPDMRGKLTMREIEVIKQSISGRKNREIAEALGIAAATVKMHKVNIYRKCGGNTPVDILRYGLRQGVIGLEDLGDF